MNLITEQINFNKFQEISQQARKLNTDKYLKWQISYKMKVIKLYKKVDKGR